MAGLRIELRPKDDGKFILRDTFTDFLWRSITFKRRAARARPHTKIFENATTITSKRTSFCCPPRSGIMALKAPSNEKSSCRLRSSGVTQLASLDTAIHPSVSTCTSTRCAPDIRAQSPKRTAKTLPDGYSVLTKRWVIVSTHVVYAGPCATTKGADCGGDVGYA
jgi:hypothetical protein